MARCFPSFLLQPNSHPCPPCLSLSVTTLVLSCSVRVICCLLSAIPRRRWLAGRLRTPPLHLVSLFLIAPPPPPSFITLVFTSAIDACGSMSDGGDAVSSQKETSTHRWIQIRPLATRLLWFFNREKNNQWNPLLFILQNIYYLNM